jgi:hypothetical protein
LEHVAATEAVSAHSHQPEFSRLAERIVMAVMALMSVMSAS